MEACPCGSSESYSRCCQPVISGQRPAETAEQLMRSRYSAYAKAEVDYIFETTHPDHRKGYDHQGTKEWAENSEWEGLEIVGVTNGGPDDATGEVEFVATYRENGAQKVHHELAHFRKDEGRWLFTDGRMVTHRPIVSNKIGRNEPCTCGSGKKYKKCCGA